MEKIEKILKKVIIFFKEVSVEMRKVNWPDRQETLRYTIIILGVTIALAAFLGALDFVFLKALGRFIF